MALNQWNASDEDDNYLKIAVHALYAMTSPTAIFRETEPFTDFAKRAVVFAKYCNVPF